MFSLIMLLKQKENERYIRTKLDPKEGEKARRLNYLKDVEKEHLGLRSSGVKDWKSLKELLKHIVSNT